MITITTKYLEELKKFFEEMGCKVITSSDRHWQTEGEVEHLGRDGEIRSATIDRREHDDYSRTYEIRIHSTPGFEQKLLRKGKKWTITVVGKGMVKPFQLYYNPQD